MKWYRKRAGRILPPYELFLSVLALVYILRNLSFPLIQWLTCVFGVQGAVVGVLGAEQTWFITPLLIGYLLTPLLSSVMDKITDRTFNIKIMSVVFLLVPCILVFVPAVSIFTVGVQVCFYCISYVLGRTYETWKLKLEPGVRYLFIMALAFVVRLAGRFLWDGSRLYDCIVAGYTQYIVALCIFLLFWSFLNGRKPGMIVQWMCNISFEVYLYHYMLIVGPLSFMSVTNSWITNSILVLFITAIVATLANKGISFVRQQISGNR